MEREQIIKGLECCKVGDDCWACPYDNVGVYSQCVPKLLEDALALIKELAEESKKWEEAYECADSACRELSSQCERLTEENERLTSNLVEQSAENIMLIGENKRLRAELEQRPPKLIITKLLKKGNENV